MSRERPPVAVTVGDPRGVGPEVLASALARPDLREGARWTVVGPDPAAARVAEAAGPEARHEPVGIFEPDGDDPVGSAGRLTARALERALELAVDGAVEGLVTGPVSKEALAAAGFPHPGHTEFLREGTGVEEVTMMMAAEETPLGGPLRMAFLTGHVPLREVPDRLTPEAVFRHTRIAVEALREWWGMERPRLAFAGVNPHASEGGLFGDEEARVLEPAARRIEAEGLAEVDGVHPADTVFRRCVEGEVDAVVVPYHDVGLAVLKTLAMERGVNVTAGLPFPRTSPDHGTAMDIAGTGRADPGSAAAALSLCLRFCRRLREAGP